MGDANPICTLGDYSKPSHEGYMNTIELPVGNNVVPLRSDTIRLVQNGCSFHELRFEDPNQHLKDFLKLADSLDLNEQNRNPLSSKRVYFVNSIFILNKEDEAKEKYGEKSTTTDYKGYKTTIEIEEEVESEKEVEEETEE
nr:MAK10-like protein [Tanacetum cinerariifolium]